MIDLTHYIKVYKNIIPLDLRNEILNDTHLHKTLERAKAGIRDVETPLRNCYSTLIRHSHYESEIHKAVGKVLNNYCIDIKHFMTGITTEDTGYVLLLYKGKEKGEYKEHTDHADLYPRVLSISLILNDNYDGGNFSFFNGQYTVKKEAGSVVAFPSNFCFPHAITPISNGDRYAIITWIH